MRDTFLTPRNGFSLLSGSKEIDRLACFLTFFRRALRSGAWTLDGNFDPAVLCPALRRIVRGDRPRVTDPLGRNNVGIDPLRDQKAGDCGGPARRQHQIVRNALPLEIPPNRRIVRIAINDDFGVLQPLEFGDNIIGELRLAGGNKLIAAGGNNRSAASTYFCSACSAASCALSC